MAQSMRVTITGIDRTLVHFRKIEANLPKMSLDMMQDFAEDMASQVRVNIEARATYKNIPKYSSGKPILVGRGLKDSINYRLELGKSGIRAIVEVEPSSPAAQYAYYFEEGYSGRRIIRPYKFFGADEELGKKIIWKKGGKINPRIAKKLRGNLLAFRWSEGFDGAGTYFANYVHRGTYPGRHPFRDAVIQVSSRMRQKLENKSGDLIKEY